VPVVLREILCDGRLFVSAPMLIPTFMTESTLLQELVLRSAERHPLGISIGSESDGVSYAKLAGMVQSFAGGLMALGASRGDRVAIYLDKRVETVVASFGAPAAGGVFVPVNPLLKPEQVAFILQDCNVRVLVTSPERLALLPEALAQCPDLRHVVVTDPTSGPLPATTGGDVNPIPVMGWSDLLGHPARPGHRVIDTDMAAILYTSGSTGKPKGVVLSHRNMVAGAKSVASYLENNAEDTLLAALPLSFDAGFSQLTTAFHVGARVVLLNYLMPRDVLKAMAREKVTGVAGSHQRAPALFRQHRRSHAARDPGAAPPARAQGQTLPDVWPDRGLSLDLPATR
jgi:acyl-CoA synthetase (AMP-forming)/AMP-acid ligase II